MKVLLDGRPIREPLAGVGQYTYNLVNNLCLHGSQDIEFKLLYFDFLGKNQLLDFKHNNLQVERFRFLHRKLFNVYAEHIGFPNIEVITGNVDVVHYTFFGWFPVRSQAKKVSTIHDVIPLDHPEWFEKTNRYYSIKSFWRQVKESDEIIAVSQYTKDRVLEYSNLDENRVKVIHNGVPLPVIQYTNDEYKATVDSLGIVGPYILYVGNIEPRKNIITLLRAYNKLALNGQVTLVIAGKPCWGFDEVFEFEQKYKLGVKFLGYVSEQQKRALLRNAMLFVYPSRYEGFGIPVIEAMQEGCPVVCADNSSLSEIVKGAGVLFDTFDADGLTDIMQSLLNSDSLRKEVGEKGRLHARKFSWESNAIETLKVYRNS